MLRREPQVSDGILVDVLLGPLAGDRVALFLFEEQAGTVEERADDPMFKSHLDNFQKWVDTLRKDARVAVKMLVFTSDGELRNMGEFGTWLASEFHALPSSTEPSNTVFVAIRMRAARWERSIRARCALPCGTLVALMCN